MSDILMDIINDIIEAGILELTDWGWCARLVPMQKADDTWRICVDYRELNKMPKKNANGLGDIVGMYDRMKDSKFFTAFDLKSAYHQLVIKPSDRHKTAFVQGFHRKTVAV